MRLLKLTRLPPDKDAQVDITVRTMIDLTIAECWTPDIQWAGHHAILPYMNNTEQAKALCDFVRARMRFEFDPEDIEHIRLPSSLAHEIRCGKNPGGDCDDIALLLATLLYSRAFPVAFVVLATSPVQREFRHVFVAARVGNRWLHFDPSVSRPYRTDGLRQRWYYVPWGPAPPPNL